ncbi:metalloregulator ArsR/SmtB family transcription factor [Patescibacteria group bacterium]|nr:metalloregulator ArsR/SmtB family transcription factor [Patescibacteria group bacterium]MBU1074863.1 metalloregulator ArsR/SmtB family transcription factor [Patescibacteria group bacterium]MBU1951469.1 metalloregulator ArsR/SmtB family transcription factor [Patescibacteria group bacterium]MBU2235865.1 metalloregulator ArsR/SmtB family transcription factor [Patescibacteria group bacterium]
MLTKQQITKNQNWLKKNGKHIKTQSDLCNILSDPTRIKVLLLLKHFDELCVSDIASILDVSVSAVSHQLSMMERSRIVANHKMGKLVCYMLEMDDKKLVKMLDTHLDKHIH